MLKSLFITSFFAATLIFGQNLIKNGNFAKLNEDGSVADWIIWPSPLPKGATIEPDTTTSASAGRSIRIAHANDSFYSRVEQVVPCKPHTNYIAFFKSRGENMNAPHGGVVKMYIGGHGNLDRALTAFGPAFDYYKLNYPKDWRYPWTKYESKVFSSGDSDSFGVCVYLHQTSGIAWIDDVELYEYTPELGKILEANYARKQLLIDLEAMRGFAAGDADVSRELDAFESRISKWMPDKHSANIEGIPFYPLHRELIAVNAKILQKRQPGRGMIVTESAPLARVSHLQSEFPAFNGVVELAGLRGERESFGLCFTNCKSEEAEITLEYSGAALFEARQVTAVEAENSVSYDDALVLLRTDADGRINFKVPAGMTRQLFCCVTFTDTPDRSDALLRWSGQSEKGEIRIEMEASAARLPEKLPIWTFSYHDSGTIFKKSGLPKIRATLERMHENAFMFAHVAELRPFFDENGVIETDKMNWKWMDEAFSRMPAKDNFFLFIVDLHVEPYLTLFLGKDKGETITAYSPEWEKRTSQYLKVIIDAFKKRGIGYDRFAFSFWDEPSDNSVDKMQKAVLFLRKLDPNVRIYNNFNSSLTENGLKRLLGMVDVVSPHVTNMTPETMALLKDSQKEIWCYWVQNKGTVGDELREFFWKLREMDVNAFSYWCLSDNSDTWSWKKQSYSVIFTGDEKEWIPSKRSEGIREGIEDYALLTLLKEQEAGEYAQIISRCGKEPWKQLRREIIHKLK